MIAFANLATDLDQAKPGWHFDNAPDRETTVTRWNHAVAQQMQRVVTWCAPRRDGRRRSRLRALWCYGRLTHTLQDFYAHTNLVELQLLEGWTGAGAPMLATQLAPADLPEQLQSGYFGLRFFTPRHRFSGCPLVDGEPRPPV